MSHEHVDFSGFLLFLTTIRMASDNSPFPFRNLIDCLKLKLKVP